MSLRTFTRIISLAAGLMLASPLAWKAAVPLLLAGLGLLGLTLGYLMFLASAGDLTRWQLRYHLPAGEDEGELEHLEGVLRYLADRAGQFVLEANATGLVLELPQAFDSYLASQLPRALPEAKLSRDDGNDRGQAAGSFFLSAGSLNGELLRWATQGASRQVRLHVHQGPYATMIARTLDAPSSGHWLRLPGGRLFGKLWHNLPLWDELSSDVELCSLFPRTSDDAVFSSRPRLLQLVPPDGYAPDPTGRCLGRSSDGRLLTLSYDTPLFTAGAPPSFLVQQALSDLRSGRSVIIVSPHRRVLESIAQETGDAPVYWLDPQNGARSAHLAIVSAAEWAVEDVEAIVHLTQSFLADLGLDIHLPTVNAFAHHLIFTLANSAKQAGQAFSFTDLYAVSQSTQVLQAFLIEVQNNADNSVQELLARLDNDAGYVQAVTTLSAIRMALKPLGVGSLRGLCQPPFLNWSQTLEQASVILVPMTNSDFPEYDQLLSAMLDLLLRRTLAAEGELNLALHLHDPHLYRQDGGCRWVDVARGDTRFSMLLDVQDPEETTADSDEGRLIFRCSETMASGIISSWNLPATISDLTELPAGTAVARLPGMVVTLKVSES